MNPFFHGHENRVEILECTLRDGSYAVDFQFTARDTGIIAMALESVGIRLIEVGHGLGLNASNTGKGEAPSTDEEYMRAAAEALVESHWGMFCIPGIARFEDLDMAADHGMHFVRIGVNAPDVEQAAPFIEKAKNLGMTVCLNLMKSYAISPADLAAKARQTENYGSDLVCLVDSAGHMLPEDVARYIKTMRDHLSVPIGFHCHDNLRLGTANVLTALEHGAVCIDTTLQGMGRGGGNPATEVLVTLLKKKGIHTGIDLNGLLDVSDRFIRPMLHKVGLDGMNVISGLAGFHSGYLELIQRYARSHAVDPRDLILSVSSVDKVHPSEDLVRESAVKLATTKSRSSFLYCASVEKIISSFQMTPIRYTGVDTTCRRIAEQARALAIKSGRQSVFNIVASNVSGAPPVISQFIQESFEFVICSIEVSDPGQCAKAVALVDGVVDILFVDSEMKPYLPVPLLISAENTCSISTVLGYRDDDLWTRSVLLQLHFILSGLFGKKITIFGLGSKPCKLALGLTETGTEVLLTGGDEKDLVEQAHAVEAISLGLTGPTAFPDTSIACESVDAVVLFAPRHESIPMEMIESLHPGLLVLDATIGSLNEKSLISTRQKGIQLIRPDMRAVLAAELTSVLNVHKITTNIMGRGKIAGVSVVAGGIIGDKGDILVDSISNPKLVVGVADGLGRLLSHPLPEDQERMVKVEREIIRNAVLGSTKRQETKEQ